MSNPFKRTGKQPRLGVKSFSVEDVKAADKRFYDKFPGAVEDAAMLKKAMQNPGDEVVVQLELGELLERAQVLDLTDVLEAI